MTAPFEERLALTQELLDDLELSRLASQALLLKANRLARILDNEPFERFVRWELHGYPPDDERAIYMMRILGRMANGVDTWRNALAHVIQAGDTAHDYIESVSSIPVDSGSAAQVLNRANQVRTANSPTLDRARNVESAVIAWLHDMVVHLHHELAFSKRQSSLFDAAQAAIDARLGTLRARREFDLSFHVGRMV